MYDHLTYDKSRERMDFVINGAETAGYALALCLIHRLKGTDFIFFRNC